MPNVDVLNLRLNREIPEDRDLSDRIRMYKKGLRSQVIKDTLLRHLPDPKARKKRASRAAKNTKSASIEPATLSSAVIVINKQTTNPDDYPQQDTAGKVDANDLKVGEPVQEEKSPLEGLIF